MLFSSVLKSVAGIPVGTTFQPFLQTKKQSAMCSVMDFNAQTPGQPVNREVPPLGSLRSMSRGPLQERVWQSGARCGVLGLLGC